MHVIAMRIAVVTFLVVTFTFSSYLRADEVPCQPPSMPDLPAGITDDNHANLLSDSIDVAMSESAGYLACIEAALESGGDAMADAERRQLETARQNHVAAMRAMAARWNGMYTSHVRRSSAN